MMKGRVMQQQLPSLNYTIWRMTSPNAFLSLGLVMRQFFSNGMRTIHN